MIKCLSKDEQESIAEWYNVVKTPISEIAFIYGVSARTIARIITEAGMVTPLARRNGECYRAMQILKQHDVLAHELNELLVLGLQAKQDAKNKYVFDYQLAQEFEDLPF